jgi:hypothetical protein
MPRRVLAALRRFGHRGSVLIGYAAVCEAYGTGLAIGYAPTFHAAFHLPLTEFGWVFIATGVTVAAGAPRRRDGAHFALAVASATGWALLIATHWASAYGWAAGVSWAGVAAGLLLASAWPDAPRRMRAPPLPDLSRLLSGGEGK